MSSVPHSNYVMSHATPVYQSQESFGRTLNMAKETPKGTKLSATTHNTALCQTHAHTSEGIKTTNKPRDLKWRSAASTCTLKVRDEVGSASMLRMRQTPFSPSAKKYLQCAPKWGLFNIAFSRRCVFHVHFPGPLVPFCKHQKSTVCSLIMFYQPKHTHVSFTGLHLQGISWTTADPFALLSRMPFLASSTTHVCRAYSCLNRVC